MNTDQIIGNAKDATGKVQDSFGAATGNADWQAQGKARQLEGKLHCPGHRRRRRLRAGRTAFALLIGDAGLAAAPAP